MRDRPKSHNRIRYNKENTILEMVQEKFNPYTGSIDQQRKVLDDKLRQSYRAAKGLKPMNEEQTQHKAAINHIFASIDKSFINDTNIGQFSISKL